MDYRLYYFILFKTLFPKELHKPTILCALAATVRYNRPNACMCTLEFTRMHAGPSMITLIAVQTHPYKSAAIDY
jgi:hypothetical protein